MSARTLNAAGPTGALGSAVHRLDARAKVLGLVGITVVAVSCSLRDWPVLVACAASLGLLAWLARVPIGELWRRGLVLVPLVIFAAVFVPLTHPGGLDAGLALLGAVTAKAMIGTMASVLLGATTPFADVLAALRALRMPRGLVLIGTLMHRYLFLLADDLARMRTALRARDYAPRTLVASGALGGMTGALFLRSHARAERVQLAMRARGFAGELPSAAAEPLGRAELLAAFGLLVLVGARVVAAA